MGKFQIYTFFQRLEQSWWTNPESLCTGLFTLWLQFRLRSIRCCEFMCSSYRYRNRWLNSLSFQCEWNRRNQTNSRPGQPGRCHSHFKFTGYCRTNGTTVRDAAILLGAIAGVDADDETTIALTSHTIPDYTKFLQANGLKGKRIGFDPSVKRHEAVDKLMTDAIEQMKSAGSILVPVSFVSEMGKLRDPEFQVLQYEFKDGINKYLKSAKAPVANLAELLNSITIMRMKRCLSLNRNC